MHKIRTPKNLSRRKPRAPLPRQARGLRGRGASFLNGRSETSCNICFVHTDYLELTAFFFEIRSNCLREMEGMGGIYTYYHCTKQKNKPAKSSERFYSLESSSSLSPSSSLSDDSLSDDSLFLFLDLGGFALELDALCGGGHRPASLSRSRKMVR